MIVRIVFSQFILIAGPAYFLSSGVLQGERGAILKLR